MSEWHIDSRFDAPQAESYVLHAPNGTVVGRYPSLTDALRAMRELQTRALEAESGRAEMTGGDTKEGES